MLFEVGEGICDYVSIDYDYEHLMMEEANKTLLSLKISKYPQR